MSQCENLGLVIGSRIATAGFLWLGPEATLVSSILYGVVRCRSDTMPILFHLTGYCRTLGFSLELLCRPFVMHHSLQTLSESL